MPSQSKPLNSALCLQRLRFAIFQCEQALEREQGFGRHACIHASLLEVYAGILILLEPVAAYGAGHGFPKNPNARLSTLDLSELINSLATTEALSRHAAFQQFIQWFRSDNNLKLLLEYCCLAVKDEALAPPSQHASSPKLEVNKLIASEGGTQAIAHWLQIKPEKLVLLLGAFEAQLNDLISAEQEY